MCIRDRDYFESIDPDEARRILDEELYGMERVKQRIIETIIQINRTHTLPAVSYTHLDVYKRQIRVSPFRICNVGNPVTFRNKLRSFVIQFFKISL